MLIIDRGYSSMVTMESWMFLATFDKLRSSIFENSTINCLLHMPYLGKGGTSMGINFGTSAFSLRKKCESEYKANYSCIRYFETDQAGVPLKFPTANERSANLSASDFKDIPGTPISYWLPKKVLEAFSSMPSLGDAFIVRGGMTTADNERFVRIWHETDMQKQSTKWFPYNKGGEYRKWYGNQNWIVNFENDGKEIRETGRASVRSEDLYRQPMVGWTDVTTYSQLGVRFYPTGFIFDATGPSVFKLNDQQSLNLALGFLGTKFASIVLQALNSTIHVQAGDLSALPLIALESGLKNTVDVEVGKLIDLSRSDWDAYETSWDFTTLPLLAPEHRDQTLAGSYARLRTHWQSMTDEMQLLEEENNRIFIDAYGLQDELTPEVPLEEITLTCNPAYRYGGKATVEELETRLRSDTMAEFLHYAVGCMFGRYSLDAPGLILANQGEGLADYLARIPEPSFDVDADNVIPVLDGDWFADDITERFRKFLRVTFGDAKFQENLAFIEAALGKDIRKWFTKDFFDYHVRRYKKRPIYWMFSSPKGTFNALIYMHRYRPDTVSVVLNDYLREFISKLQAERGRMEKLVDDPSAMQSQRVKAQKDVGAVIKQIAELEEWEREVVFPLAQAKIEIDLDDGVKRNYPLFGAALKPIKGLEAADE